MYIYIQEEKKGVIFAVFWNEMDLITRYGSPGKSHS